MPRKNNRNRHRLKKIDQEKPWYLKDVTIIQIKNAFSSNFDLRIKYISNRTEDITQYAIYDHHLKELYCDVCYIINHLGDADGHIIEVPDICTTTICDMLYFNITEIHYNVNDKITYYLPTSKEEHDGLILYLKPHVFINDIISIISHFIFEKIN